MSADQKLQAETTAAVAMGGGHKREAAVNGDVSREELGAEG